MALGNFVIHIKARASPKPKGASGFPSRVHRIHEAMKYAPHAQFIALYPREKIRPLPVYWRKANASADKANNVFF